MEVRGLGGWKLLGVSKVLKFVWREGGLYKSNYQFRVSYDVISRQIDVAFQNSACRSYGFSKMSEMGRKKLALVYKYKIEHLMYAETSNVGKNFKRKIVPIVVKQHMFDVLSDNVLISFCFKWKLNMYLRKNNRKQKKNKNIKEIVFEGRMFIIFSHE